MFNKKDVNRNQYMLKDTGYDWWWHSFTAHDEKGEEKPFFIEYFLINPKYGKESPVFGQLPEKNKPSYLMIKAGCWKEGAVQLHRFFGWDSVQIQRNPYQIMADDCLACETRLIGSIDISKEESENHPEWMCDDGQMSWDLHVDKEIAFNVGYGTSKLFRETNAFEMYWHAQGMKTKYAGTIVFNGKKYEVDPDTCFGYADKNWGQDFTSPWVWLSSNHMVSNLTGKRLENSVFDIGGGRPKVFFVPLPRKLLGVFYHEGKEYDFNFSHFWKGVHTIFHCEEKEDQIEWKVVQSNLKYHMKTHIICDKKDMLLVNYESPDGQKRHKRLWNGGNGVGRITLYKRVNNKLELIEDVNVYNVGCEFGEYEN